MRLNELFQVIAADDSIGLAERRHLYSVLRTVLTRRNAMGIDNDVRELVRSRDAIVAEISDEDVDALVKYAAPALVGAMTWSTCASFAVLVCAMAVTAAASASIAYYSLK